MNRTTGDIKVMLEMRKQGYTYEKIAEQLGVSRQYIYKLLKQYRFKSEGVITMNNPQIKSDCFGYENKQCTVLKEMVCKYKECPFYKTNEQYAADKEKYSIKVR